MADFPEHLFSLGGSPEAIAGSARRYDRFGESAAHAAERITSMDTGQFQGPEGEQFREKVDSELPPDLRATGTAFSQVGTALNTFSSRLSELQGKMRPLAHQAPGLWEQLKASEGRVERAQSADRAHTQAEQDRVAHAPAGQAPPRGPAYESDTGDASAALSSARAAWQDCVDKANGLRTEMTAAARECTNRINEAKGMRFKEPPASYDLIGQGQDFIRENKDVLKEISSALKVVSGALAVVGLVLQAIPVVGNAVGGAFLIAAGITGGAALAIDAGIYAATGEGSLTSILVDTALTIVPVGRVLKVGGTLLRAAGRTGLAKAAKAGIGRVGRQLGDAAAHVTQRFQMQLRSDPIDVASGRMVADETDVELGGALPLTFQRTHLSSYRSGLFFGPSWASTLDQRLEIDEDGVYFASEDGLTLAYPRAEPGETVHPTNGPQWPLARSHDGNFTITDVEQGRTLHFTRFDGYWPLTAITDRNGDRIQFTYDDTGLPLEVHHSGGYRVRVETTNRLVTALYLCGADDGRDLALMRYRYQQERLTEVINPSGQPMRVEYDGPGRITAWTDRNDCWYRYLYDDEGRCVRTEGAGGFLNSTFTYDRENAVTYVSDSLGNETAFHLGESGQILREIDPRGGQTLSEWDERHRLLARTDALGRTTEYEYDEDGNLAVVTRPDGQQARFAYNDLRLPITIVAPDGTISHREYDDNGNLTRIVDPTGAATSYGYDAAGHLARVTDALGNTRTVESNAAGLPTTVTDALGAHTSYERDAFGRVVAITDALGGVTRFGWTIDGKPAWHTLPDGATERWFYDAEGNVRTHVGVLGETTHTKATYFDLPSAEVRPDGTRLEFGYDTELRLTSVTNQQGLVWRYAYDHAGHLTSETDFNGRTITYRHDAAGQLVERTNGAGESTVFVRNTLGEVAERRSGDSVAAFHYDEAGRLRAATNADAHVTFERDPLGRVVTETINGRTVNSTYDPLGRRTRRVTPSGVESRWEYDANGDPMTLHTAGHMMRFTFDAAGRETERVLGAGAVLTQNWDAKHQLVSQTLTGAKGRQTQHRAFTYRTDGVPAVIDDQLNGRRDFALDTAGRVTGVQGSGWTERYAYDAAGNITSASWPASEDSIEADALGEREYSGTLIRRAGKVRYEHDGQGRLVLRQRKRLSQKPATWHYSWDADDRLVGVSTPEGARWWYRYDPLGRRVAKQRLDQDGSVAEKIDFHWDGFALVEQIHTGGTPDVLQPSGKRITAWDYEPGSFRPLTQLERSSPGGPSQGWFDEQFHSIISDVAGFPMELIDEHGEIDRHRRTTVWGSVDAGTGDGATTPLRFPGQYFDPESQLSYNFQRHYDPATGRYGSSDPLGLLAGLNPHMYVANPLVLTDPLGLYSCSQLLGQNMAREGRPVGPGQAAAHIVPSGFNRGGGPQMRALLQRYGVDINDAANGIPLGHHRPHNYTHSNAFLGRLQVHLEGLVEQRTADGYGARAIRTALRGELRSIGRQVEAELAGGSPGPGAYWTPNP
ncbi:DUF6531 domain-containing protein [Saccharopolyspora sp. SCSIO 74807]|uniref:DUF6531 domain-containing protein n=1 Tax=Saccharopolyspora sp. SCSIO 74807 TaxID=3118084 RepID=UPI0030CBE40A